MAQGANSALLSEEAQQLPLPNERKPKIILDERGLLDVPFLVLTVLLVTIGVIMMFSASYARAYELKGNSTYYFARQAIFAVVGIGMMLFVSRINYQIWRGASLLVLLAAVFFLLLVPVIGTTENGAKRWLNLGFMSFQPSELAKLAIILSFASLMSTYREKMQTFRYGVLPFAAILIVICGLLMLERHFSGIIIMLVIGATMMFLGGVQVRWFVIGGALFAIFAVVYLKTMGYASERVTAWRDPASDPSDAGYQILQSLYSIGSGGLMGLGLGRSRQKYLYLPEEHNDYIFSIVCEELGFVGALVIILLFILLIVRGYWIAMHARDRFGALTAAGISTLLAVQVFFNIGVVTNFLPATGISLPFFSYGGTALLLQLFEMGIVLSVSRQNDNKML
jgi:cell division protein FtsW